MKRTMASITAAAVFALASVSIINNVLRDVTAGIVPDGAGMLLPFPLLNQVGHYRYRQQ